MCTVKVFLASDAMRRTGGRGSAPESRGGVRRKLFDAELPPNPAGAGAPASNFLRRIWEEIEKESEKKWNFDFKREAPLPGRFEWVPVGGAVDEGAERPARVGDGTPVVREVRAQESPRSATQRKITEFMSQRKRARAPEAPSVSKVRRRSLETNESTGTTT